MAGSSKSKGGKPANTAKTKTAGKTETTPTAMSAKPKTTGKTKTRS